MKELTCFKAYDIRGQLGEELNNDIAYRIGRAYGEFLVKDSTESDDSKTVVVGGDIRLTSEELKLSLADGLMDAGVNVIDLGMTGTEEIYFATSDLNVDGGVEVTASHNPLDYNGMKLVRELSKPISGDTGLLAIKDAAEKEPWKNNVACNLKPDSRGSLTKNSNLNAYVDHLLTYVNAQNITPLKLVVNSGNGAAGHVIDAIEAQFKRFNVPIEFIKVNHQADGTFPNGIPNPLLIENRQDTIDAVIKHKADMGIAWDGDFDRCFLFDEKGQFIEGYYIVGLLADAFLQKSVKDANEQSNNASTKIIHDPRLTWNTIDVVNAAGGEAVLCKTGHAFIKERMRKEDAVYGGEMSAHHYFRDFMYCDSGMIPWLLVAELLCVKKLTLSDAVAARIAAYPSSGEINSKLADPKASIETVLNTYQSDASVVDYTDGISLEFADAEGEWRFNLRSSNTEPVVRLNVESKGNIDLMERKTEELLKLLRR